MAGPQRRRANSDNENNNQKHDHRDVILEGLGEQLRQILERLERLVKLLAAGAAHEGVPRHAY